VKKLSATLVLLLACYPAQSAEWVYVTSGTNSNIRVDASSVVELKSGIRKAWVEYAHETDEKTSKGIAYRRLLELNLYRCDDRTSAISQQINYSALGNVVHSITVPKSLITYEEVAPDSLNEATLDFACKIRLKKK
jgi:hypothetical protein